MLLANHYSIDLEEALTYKLQKNELKYPLEKFRNSSKKYNMQQQRQNRRVAQKPDVRGIFHFPIWNILICDSQFAK